MTAHDKYSLLHRDNLRPPLQMQLFEKQIIFSKFFLHFWNLYQILNIFMKKMTLLADVFLKLETPKNLVRSMSKESSFKGPFEKQHGKRAQLLLKSEQQHCHHIYYHSESNWVWKVVSVPWKLLRLLFNTMTVNQKYSLLNRDNLTQPIQILLSEQQKANFHFFWHFWNLY